MIDRCIDSGVRFDDVSMLVFERKLNRSLQSHDYTDCKLFCEFLARTDKYDAMTKEQLEHLSINADAMLSDRSFQSDLRLLNEHVSAFGHDELVISKHDVYDFCMKHRTGSHQRLSNVNFEYINTDFETMSPDEWLQKVEMLCDKVLPSDLLSDISTPDYWQDMCDMATIFKYAKEFEIIYPVNDPINHTDADIISIIYKIKDMARDKIIEANARGANVDTIDGLGTWAKSNYDNECEHVRLTGKPTNQSVFWMGVGGAQKRAEKEGVVGIANERDYSLEHREAKLNSITLSEIENESEAALEL